MITANPYEQPLPSQAQLDWLDERAARDPNWAMTEFNIRQRAVEVQRMLHESANRGERARIAVGNPWTASFRLDDPRQIYGVSSSPVEVRMWRVGGAEELLLIEECIRRGMYGEGWDAE